VAQRGRFYAGHRGDVPDGVPGQVLGQVQVSI
jgi:hypothetical protein